VMAATKTIPIVFTSGEDPVTSGLVANLNRPGGNVTGVSFFDVPLSGKRLGLLHEVVPKSRPIALLLDSKFAAADAEARELEMAARANGRQVVVVKAADENEIEIASSTLAQSAAGGLLVGGGPFSLDSASASSNSLHTLRFPQSTCNATLWKMNCSRSSGKREPPRRKLAT